MGLKSLRKHREYPSALLQPMTILPVAFSLTLEFVLR